MDKKIEYSWQRVTLLMVVAYFFSFAVRMYWIAYFQDEPSFFWNNELMINTNDGYFFASMAQRILEDMHIHNPRVLDGWRYGVVALTVLFVKITPFSLETIILYMPAIISSLVIVPIILIGKLYKNLSLGFFAALIGSIAWSYYNRTMMGYYDTDMFSAMAPMFILYFLLATIETEKDSYALLSALSILVYPFLYDSGLSLVYAMGVFYMLYMLFFHRKEQFTYYSILLIAVALMGLPWYLKLVMIIVGYVLLKQNKFELKPLMIAAGMAVLIFFITGNVFSLIYGKLMVYTVRGTQENGLMFYQVAQTVREAGQIPFSLMANRISGSTIGVIIALLGYITLVWKHKSFILALPLIGIGVFSLVGGLRFTVFAVPVAAISAVYILYLATTFIKLEKVRLVVLALLVSVFLYPNVTHIIEYKVPTVLTKNEVKILDNLKSIGSDKDYIIAWWDYGYPLWFYTNKNTLIDGGKHQNDNYIVSKILTTSSQKEAASLARIAVETYVSSDYKNIADTIFKNRTPEQLNVESYFEELDADALEIPKATREVFLYMPYRMIDIFPTVKVFSNINLDTGEKISSPFFYKSSNVQQNEALVNFGSGVSYDQNSGYLNVGDQKVPVFEVVTTGIKPNGRLGVSRQHIHDNGVMAVVILQNYNSVLILDREMFNSTYIQMFFLENYDKTLFEPVEMSAYAKVYRVKI